MTGLLQRFQALSSQSKKRISVAAALIVILAGIWYSNAQQPTPEAAEEPRPISFQSEFQVHVTGAVEKPGLYTVDAGARVQDAIDKAGGLAEGAIESSVNLARLLSDGEQVVVLHENQINENQGGYLSLNRADAAQLEELPGIGPATAKKIIEFRKSIGSFASIEQLQEVPGIGPKLFEQIRDQLTL